jgi:PBP1b-binding outer membrane lipoprotein LpoB
MKLAGIIVLALLVLTIWISGCVREPAAPPTTGALTQEQAEQQAFQTLEQEMDDSIGGMTLEDLENELLQQG